jgi:ceramide glucosyltransferase
MKRLAWLAFAIAGLLAIGLIELDVTRRAAHLVIFCLALFCGTVAVLGIAYTLFAAALVRRFFSRSTAESTSSPPVTIVKPLHGDEWSLLGNLSSFCRQDYPGAVQFLFGVHDSQDPALKTVEELRRLHPEADITVVADARLYGPNRKISNILNMLPKAQHDVLVFADSDVSVSPNYLRNVIGELQKPDVGLVTCVYRGQPDPGLWPRLSAATINYLFLPGVVVGLALCMARPCLGPTIAMRRETLDKIGGFAPFVHHLAEDHAIGEAVRMIGKKVVIPPFAVSHACVESSFVELIAHELRRSRTIRSVAPAGHLGSALTHPLAFALLTVGLSGSAGWSWSLALIALLARFALKVQTDHELGRPCRNFWLLLPCWDIGSFLIFVASYFSMRVTWRGFRFEVDGEGFLSSVKDD